MASNKLTAKAARLDFSALPGGLPASVPPAAAPAAAQAGAAAPGPVPAGLPAPGAAATAGAGAAHEAPSLHRPKTAPGAMMAFATDARSDLMRENDSLRARAQEAEALRGQLDEALGDLAQWDGAKAARLLDPRQVDASRFANRHALNYSTPEFAALRAEIESAGGNVQPIKVRRMAAADGGSAGSVGVAAAGDAGSAEAERYELVFGHRRHRACLELGLPVLAVIDNLDDRALFVEMDRENRARKDLSAWEQGMMYRRALQQGLFASNRKLAEAIGVDLSALGKALALADLPEAIVQAFASPLALQFRWAKPLADALAANRGAVLACAQTQAAGAADRKPRDVFDRLVAAGQKGVEPFHPPQTITLERDGVAVGTVTQGGRGEVTVSLKPGQVPAEKLVALAECIDEFLRRPTGKR
ncbi:ParB/RepB/Spo0J family partition protein [Aquabacterium sp. OR-4]|uniref:ParB/RepB/Spo0J family partition protein n=1 Tax=Aquabacterium sp. OR-4 TaxID=2978127 RepID=UPI0028C95108|nr:ParB/RepB/Spo0J family partition protein [Aquabacterium sp. OR-4]MDT7838529.1 ParB/RepB/Spo0J family partition protein [Aquabacterium sp. OR-4]